MKCNQCNKHFHKRLDGSVKLTYFEKKLYFCSHKCHHTYTKENFPFYLKWLKQYHPDLNPDLKDHPRATIEIYPPNIAIFTDHKKEWAWLITDMKALISKEDAISLYDSERHGGFLTFFKKMQEDYPKLYKYYRKTADE